MLDWKFHIIISISVQILLSDKVPIFVLAITRSNDLFLERGKRGLSLEPFGRGGQLSAKWADHKKENFWPLKLMTRLHWETVWWRNHFCNKNHIFLSSLLRQNMFPFWGIFRGVGISSLSKFSPNCLGTEVPKYPLLVQTICIYRFARSSLHRISLYKYY